VDRARSARPVDHRRLPAEQGTPGAVRHRGGDLQRAGRRLRAALALPGHDHRGPYRPHHRRGPAVRAHLVGLHLSRGHLRDRSQRPGGPDRPGVPAVPGGRPLRPAGPGVDNGRGTDRAGDRQGRAGRAGGADTLST
jgi:hypothetical protein